MPAKNQKKCVICGAMFFAPPSDKTVTCSPACRSARASRAAKNARKEHPDSYKWSPERRKEHSSDPKVREKMRAMQKKGTAAAMALPEGQRGPQNRTSKYWILITPDGQLIEVKNLTNWARENYTLFEPECEDPEKAANRIRGGFTAIADYMRGAKSRKRPVTTYKGWGLYALPTKEDAKNGE